MTPQTLVHGVQPKLSENSFIIAPRAPRFHEPTDRTGTLFTPKRDYRILSRLLLIDSHLPFGRGRVEQGILICSGAIAANKIPERAFCYEVRLVQRGAQEDNMNFSVPGGAGFHA